MLPVQQDLIMFFDIYIKNIDLKHNYRDLFETNRYLGI